MIYDFIYFILLNYAYIARSHIDYLTIRQRRQVVYIVLGHVHTNPFSFENRAWPRIENASKVFRPHYNRKMAFSNVSTLESVFEKLRFPPSPSVTEDAGLVWTKGPTV